MTIVLRIAKLSNADKPGSSAFLPGGEVAANPSESQDEELWGRHPAGLSGEYEAGRRVSTNHAPPGREDAQGP